MQDDREAWDALLNFLEDVEAELRRLEHARLRVARALLRRELVCAMRSTDSDSQRINARLRDELLDLGRVGVGGISSVDLYSILDAGELAELSLDNDVVSMSILDDFLRQSDVVLEGILRAIDHDRREAAIDAGLAGLEISAMVEVQGDRNIVDLESSLDEVHEISMLGILAGTGRALQDDRRVQLASGLGDALDNLHVVDVESTDGVAALMSLLEHFFSSN